MATVILVKTAVEIRIDKAAWDAMTAAEIQLLSDDVEDRLEMELVSAGRQLVKRLGNRKLSYKVE